MKNLRIVFMGTPGFAVATLGSLLMNGFNVTGIVTAPDKPAGRGQKIKRSAVRQYSESCSIPIFQPENLRDPGFAESLKKLSPDIFIVVAFRMLPDVIWKIPLIGTINLHASLLPQYRGAAPINHVIINGETSTGVTTFFIDDKIDTGGILLREEVHISPCENAGELHDRLMKYGARLVIQTLTAVSENRIMPQPQTNFMLPGEILKPAPKIYPEDCIIDWNQDPRKIYNLIRGLSPYPCARSFLKKGSLNLILKIFEGEIEMAGHLTESGSFLSDGRHYLKVACNGGFINILSLQPEGKRKMSTTEFLRGIKVSDFDIMIS